MRRKSRKAMNTIMNTAEFIRVTDLLKKEKIAKNSGNIFAAMMAMRENRPEAICADGFKMSIQASEDHYCQKDDEGSYVSVEVGFPSPPEPLLDEYGDDGVYGYVPLTVVDAIIAKHGGILLDEQ
jgi:hypothetical protein